MEGLEAWSANVIGPHTQPHGGQGVFAPPDGPETGQMPVAPNTKTTNNQNDGRLPPTFLARPEEYDGISTEFFAERHVGVQWVRMALEHSRTGSLRLVVDGARMGFDWADAYSCTLNTGSSVGGGEPSEGKRRAEKKRGK